MTGGKTKNKKKQIFWVFQRSRYRFRCSIHSHVLSFASYWDAQIPSSAIRKREREREREGKVKVAVGREPLSISMVLSLSDCCYCCSSSCIVIPNVCCVCALALLDEFLCPHCVLLFFW
jgi:hypothetical protein